MNTAPARGRPRSETTHRAILDAAFAVLESDGYKGAAIERIASEAGVAKQTIYRWWASKAHLFLEVLGDKATRTVAPPDTGSLEGDLAVLLSDTFRAVSGELRPLMRALAVELLQDEGFAETMRDVFVERRRENIRTLVAKAVDRGEVTSSLDADLACDIAFGAMWYRLMFDHAPLNEEYAKALAAQIARSGDGLEAAAQT